MKTQQIIDEIVAVLDRERVPNVMAALILTEVAAGRVFKDAVVVSLDSRRKEDFKGRSATPRKTRIDGRRWRSGSYR